MSGFKKTGFKVAVWSTTIRHRIATCTPAERTFLDDHFDPSILAHHQDFAIFRVARRRDGVLLGYFLAVANPPSSRGISLSTGYPEAKEYDIGYNLALQVIDDRIELGADPACVRSR